MSDSRSATALRDLDAVRLWSAVRRAAARDGGGHAARGHLGHAATVADLATVGGVPRLGWVLPPPVPAVARRLLRYRPLLEAGRTTLVGTGAWAFTARAATGGAVGGLRVVDRLGAAAGPATEAVVAVSESGTTLETRLLAATLAAAWGVEPVALGGTDLWLDPAAPSGALFAAPLSVPFLLAAALDRAGRLPRRATGDPAMTAVRAVLTAYRGFAARSDEAGLWASAVSRRIATAPGRVALTVPADLGEGMRLFALQLLRQGLGGKDGGPHLWWDVDGGAPCPRRASTGTALRLGPPPLRHGNRLTRLMLHCYAVAALVACTGARHGVRFAAHPAVDNYKRLVASCLTDPPEAVDVTGDGIVVAAATWLSRREHLARAHLVRYDPHPARALPEAERRLESLTGRRWEAHPGSTWNHHSYQAVAGERHTGVVAVYAAPAPTPCPSRDPAATQAALAGATCASLGHRALLLRTAGTPHRPATPVPTEEPMPT
jgi:hypothetical protein